MSAHAVLPPSGAPCWVNCTGWVMMNQMYPGTSTPASRDGDAAHWVGSQMIHSHCRGNLDYPKQEGTDPAGTVITPEIYQSALVYSYDVAQVIDSTRIFGGDHIGIEQRITCPDISEHNWGTTDCFIWDDKTWTLYDWDFKNGHKYVDEFENFQMIDYVSGILSRIGINGANDTRTTVVMRIVQPNVYTGVEAVREWRVNAAELRGYFNRLREAAYRALQGENKLCSGPHCKYCEARHVCPAARKAGLALYEAIVPLGIEELSPENIGLQLSIVRRAIEQLESLDTAYTAQVTSLIKSGAAVPGWFMDQVYGHRKFMVPDEELFAMGDALGVQLYDKKPVTPAEAERRKLDKNIVAAMTTKSSSLKLTYDSGTAARKVFGSWEKKQS